MSDTTIVTSTSDGGDTEAVQAAASLAAANQAGAATSEAVHAQQEAAEAQETASAAGAVAGAAAEQVAEAREAARLAEARAMSAEQRLDKLESYLLVRDAPPRAGTRRPRGGRPGPGRRPPECEKA